MWAQGRFSDALYLSLVTVATPGFGDITPTTPWLRVLVPLEALIGFAILTAGLSWVLSVYPVLHRRALFAHRVIVERHANASTDEHWLARNPLAAEPIVLALIELRSDLTTFPITFYFRPSDTKSAFPVALALLDRRNAEGA